MSYDKDCTALERFKKMDQERSTLLNEYVKYSSLTVPWVCTEMGYDENSTLLQDDWDSTGHHAVTNLVNKLMMGLFSPTKPFFRLQASDQIRAAIAEQTNGGGEPDLNQIFSKTEKAAQRLFEKLNLRQPLTSALTGLVVIGTSLLKLDKKGKHRVFNVRNYVLRRNMYGHVVEFLTCDKVKFETLDKKIKDSPTLSKYKDDDKVNLVEWFKLNDEETKWTSTMWVDDDKLPGKYDGGWKVEDFPYIALTWNLPDGMNYGVGQVQACIADLEKNRVVSKSEAEMTIMLAQHRYLVNPGSATDPTDIENSENGDVIPGREGDIAFLSFGGSTQNLAAVSSVKQNIERKIAESFLMSTGITRDAERVTATEIRAQIQELETSLGGIYTRIASELQLPIAYFLLNNLEEESRLKVDGNDIQPIIITGVDALSRSGENEDIVTMFNILGPLASLPPGLQQVMNFSGLIKTIGANLGVDTSQIILSDEQIAANQQMQMQAQMAGAEGPDPGTTPTAV